MIALLAMTAFAAPAWNDGFPIGPVEIGLQPGNLGAPRRAVGRTEFGVSGAMGLVADTPNFYGHIAAAGAIDGSVNWGLTELYGRIEAVRYDTVLGAIASDRFGIGHGSLGLTQGLSRNWPVNLAIHGRFLFPTAVGLWQNAYPLGMDLGLAADLPLGERFRLHGDLTLAGSLMMGAGPAGPRGGLGLTVGGEWRPGRNFGLVADVRSGFLYDAPVDDVSAALGFRFAFGSRYGLTPTPGALQLGAVVPLAGRKWLPLAQAELRFTWRFGGPGAERQVEPRPQPERGYIEIPMGVPDAPTDGR
jgi:hypothetical protein